MYLLDKRFLLHYTRLGHAVGIARLTHPLEEARRRSLEAIDLGGAEDGALTHTSPSGLLRVLPGQHLPAPPATDLRSAPSSGAPVPDDPRKNFLPSVNVTSRPLARGREWSFA